MPHRAHQHGELALAIMAYHQPAEAALDDPAEVARLLEEVRLPASQYPKLAESLDPLCRLVRAYAGGEYRAADREDVALALAALMYVASPWDLTPDYLPGGLHDDQRAATWVYERISDTITSFDEWEHSSRRYRTTARPIPADGAA